MDSKTISGFSKLSKRGKIKWIVENFFKEPETVMQELMSYWHSNEEKQKILDGFSENTISNFPMPFGVAPNFMINGKAYAVPMVIEESSVVAAASSAAKFWMKRGGFKSEVIDTIKIGQLHFKWKGDFAKLQRINEEFKSILKAEVYDLTRNMEKRGGGIIDLYFKDFDHDLKDLRQLVIEFETCDSMGANFINSVLEKSSDVLENFLLDCKGLTDEERDYEKIMAILSNYTPDCLVRCSVSCKIEDLGKVNDLNARQFAERFFTAVRIAEIDPYRATTHNKGIFNGIDSVVIATGNDFRAIEACGHSYAARKGKYSSLSHCSIEEGIFKFWIDIPLALGTVGGLTNLHPVAKRSLEMLGQPNSRHLMEIIAAVGLAQNFAAIRSLITTGIQKGHMKMHLVNILNHLQATECELKKSLEYFKDHTISYSNVSQYLESLRTSKGDTSIKQSLEQNI